jgi:hypothetical protein
MFLLALDRHYSNTGPDQRKLVLVNTVSSQEAGFRLRDLHHLPVASASFEYPLLSQ